MIFLTTMFVTITLYILLSGKVILNLRLKTQVKQLFSMSGEVFDKSFHLELLEGLPARVHKYFRPVLPDNQHFISCVRITQDGQFRTGIAKHWMDINGEQYATAARRGFIRKGVNRFYTARDRYMAAKGWLVVSVLSMIRVVNEKGRHSIRAN